MKDVMAVTATIQSLSEIVKPMERGQITIPVTIRKKLEITSQTWLWVKLLKNGKILIEPVEKKPSFTSLSTYLKSIASDSKIYWSKQDSLALEKIRRKSSERLKRLV